MSLRSRNMTVAAERNGSASGKGITQDGGRGSRALSAYRALSTDEQNAFVSAYNSVLPVISNLSHNLQVAVLQAVACDYTMDSIVARANEAKPVADKKEITLGKRDRAILDTLDAALNTKSEVEFGGVKINKDDVAKLRAALSFTKAQQRKEDAAVAV